MRRSLAVSGLIAAAAVAAGLVVALRDPLPVQANGPVVIGAGADDSSPTSPDTTPDERVDAAMNERFPDASAAVATVAAAIAAGGPIPPDGLEALTPEQLNAGYSVALAPRRGYTHTLLREAYLAVNPAAAEQLIAAGADPFINENELPYIALQGQPGSDLSFPDFSDRNRLLSLWLGAGGDPDAYNPARRGMGPLLNVVPDDNLEGMILLLGAGADP